MSSLNAGAMIPPLHSQAWHPVQVRLWSLSKSFEFYTKGNRSHCRTLSGSGGAGAAAFSVEAMMAVRSSLRKGGTKSDALPLEVDCSCSRDSSLEFFLKGRDSLGNVFQTGC